MPTYEYKCPDCSFKLDVFHKVNEKPTVCCLSCNTSKDMVKIISASSFQLKGKGFYQTDYKNAG